MISTVLKELASEIASPLCHIFESSFSTGEVSFDWRCANVTPIYKKGKKNLASNYRPVSLTSQIGKVMEAIIKDDLMGHLKQHNLIRNSQHGFWSGRSCLTNL